MTIAAKLLTLDGIKTDIKAALEALGVDMTDAKFSDYSDKILEITSDGNIVTFFNKPVTTLGTFSVDIVPTFTTYDHNG